MAERYGTTPSRLLHIPPERDWLSYCVDEALHILAAGHEWRNRRWRERFEERDGDANLYDKIMRDPQAGKAPSRETLRLLPTADSVTGEAA